MSLQMSHRNVPLLTTIEGTAHCLVSSTQRLRLRTKSEVPKKWQWQWGCRRQWSRAEASPYINGRLVLRPSLTQPVSGVAGQSCSPPLRTSSDLLERTTSNGRYVSRLTHRRANQRIPGSENHHYQSWYCKDVMGAFGRVITRLARYSDNRPEHQKGKALRTHNSSTTI